MPLKGETLGVCSGDSQPTVFANARYAAPAPAAVRNRRRVNLEPIAETPHREHPTEGVAHKGRGRSDPPIVYSWWSTRPSRLRGVIRRPWVRTMASGAVGCLMLSTVNGVLLDSSLLDPQCASCEIQTHPRV